MQLAADVHVDTGVHFADADSLLKIGWRGGGLRAVDSHRAGWLPTNDDFDPVPHRGVGDDDLLRFGGGAEQGQKNGRKYEAPPRYEHPQILLTLAAGTDVWQNHPARVSCRCGLHGEHHRASCVTSRCSGRRFDIVSSRLARHPASLAASRGQNACRSCR